MKHLISGAGVALVLGLMAGNAVAYQAYQLYHNKWAIECKDGSVHGYSGSAAGLSTVGPALCEGHGGVVGPSGGGGAATNASPASSSANLLASPAAGNAAPVKIKKARPVQVR